MPGDETYTHAIDAVAGFGPWWALAAALLLVVVLTAWRVIPMWDARKTRELDIAQQREERMRAELDERIESGKRTAEADARMADAVRSAADSQRAVATALEVVSAKFDASAAHSSHMGEQVETIAHQVDDIHAATVRGR